MTRVTAYSAVGGGVVAILGVILAIMAPVPALMAGLLAAIVLWALLYRVLCPGGAGLGVSPSVTMAAPIPAPAGVKPTPPAPIETLGVADPAVSKPRVQAAPEANPGATRPNALSAPRDGASDDLTRIKGIGPKLAGLCHELGIYHFDQIAVWGAAEIAWMDANLEGFKGRVSRDNWVSQAKALTERAEA